MRIDDENKVVLPNFVAEFLENERSRTLRNIFLATTNTQGKSYSNELDRWFTCQENCKKFAQAYLCGYTVEPQKYYWRKKKEYLAWFEEGKYLQKRGDNLYLARSSYDISKGPVNTFKYFTEQQARDLLKDDFDKFEKVECE